MTDIVEPILPDDHIMGPERQGSFIRITVGEYKNVKEVRDCDFFGRIRTQFL